jgi:hypothetical protein
MELSVEAAKAIVEFLNSLTPLGLAGGLAYIIYQLVAKRGTVRTISDNHLSGLPEMAASLERMERTLLEIRDGISFLKGRINGKG